MGTEAPVERVANRRLGELVAGYLLGKVVKMGDSGACFCTDRNGEKVVGGAGGMIQGGRTGRVKI